MVRSITSFDHIKDQIQQPPTKYDAVSLGTHMTLRSPKIIGKNKSSMPWKKQSKRSPVHVPQKGMTMTWQEKTDAKKKAKALQERVKEMRDRRRESKVAVANRKKLKAKQKKINEMRSSTY